MVKKLFVMFFVLISVSSAQIVPPQEKSEAKEVTVKKSFGNVNMELFCGIVRPYEVKVPNPLIIMIENKKGFTSKISYMKLTLISGKKRLFIEAERGFANKDYTKLELRGLKKIENKGFSIPPNSHTLLITLRKDKVTISRVN